MSERKMSIVECEDKARDEGFNCATFDLCGPGGNRPCRWLDAYMGAFVIEGENGFCMTRDVKGLGLWCENFSSNKSDEA